MDFKKRIIPAFLVGTLIVSSIDLDGFERVAANTNKLVENMAPEKKITNLMVNQEEGLSSGNTIVTSNGDNEYSLTTFESDVQVEENNGWKAIDTTLIPDNDGGFVTKETKLDIKFSEELNPKESFIEVTNDADQKVEFSLASIETSEGLIPIQKSEGEISENVITYRDILDGIDLRHIVLNTEIKEDVILNEKIEGLKSINYILNTKLIPTLSKEGKMVLSDAKGEKIYEMPAPNMSDSKVSEGGGFSEPNYDVEYQLIKKENHYEVKLIPTSKWLEEDRVYPVYIDPTLIKNVSLDTFVTSAAPDRGHNQYWNSSLGQYVLRVGKYDSSTGTNYALVKMYTLDNLKGADVTSATLKTFVNWSYYATAKTEMWVDKVASSWSENNVTWNTRPPSTGITSTTVARNEWASFNVTNAVKEVVTGKRADYGFKFHSNGNEMTHWKQLSAGENGKNITNLSVTYSYPQMQPLTTNPFPSGAGATTGYVNVSWPSINGATGYRLQMFDGKGWQTVYNGLATSFTTKNKKMWPLSSQYGVKDANSGGIKFRSGDGQELPMDPTEMYSISSGVTTTSKAFQFRVIADYPLGSSAPSKIAKPVLDGIIPSTPSAPTVSSTVLDPSTSRGHFVLDWDEVEGATSYDLQFFNGVTYERIPVGNTTQWSSKGKGIFPTESQLYSNSSSGIFRQNGDGTDFLADPLQMYWATDSKYAGFASYYFAKIIAKSSKGESLPSAFTRIWLPTATPVVSSKGYFSVHDDDSGHLVSTWPRINDAKGYIVSLHNGEHQQIVDRIGSNLNYWSSKHRGIWPSNLSDKLFKSDGSGEELSRIPGKLYGQYDETNLTDNNYYIDVQSYRGEDTSKALTDPQRYFGLSKTSEEKGSSVISISDVENGAVKVNTRYEQMSEPSVTVVSSPNLVDQELESTTETVHLKSDLYLEWEPIDNVLKYQVMIYNGHDYTYFDVPGDETQWSTADKKIFPTEEQMGRGELSFRTNEDGQDIVKNPSELYTRVNQKFGLPTVVKDYYQIRITAVHEDGARPPSAIQEIKLPLESPEIGVTHNIIKTNGSREIQLSWEKAEGTTSELYLYNGKTYNKYNLGEKTTWNSDEAKVYPSDPSGQEFVDNLGGSVLPKRLDDLYRRNGLSEDEIRIAPLLKLKIRTFTKEGEFSESELEIEYPENEIEKTIVSVSSVEETIIDGFHIESNGDSIEILAPKPTVSVQRRALFKALSKFMEHGRVQIRKPKNDKDTKGDLVETVKVKSKNNNNTKPGLDAAKAYMQNKDHIAFPNVLPGAKKPLILKNERFGHMLYRHDLRYWIGTSGPGKSKPQTFFPPDTTNTQILNALSKTLHARKSKIANDFLKYKGEKFFQYDAYVDGKFYRVGIQKYADGSSKNPQVTQFYPKIQYWRY